MFYKIFDKTFEGSDGRYGLQRFTSAAERPFVEKNHQAIIDYFHGNYLLILRHIHTDIVIDANDESAFGSEWEADGSVCTKSRIILTVQSADCVPVLLIDCNQKAIGAAHCSWRSTKANILARVVELMRSNGVKDIFAILGPAIHQSHYEVGRDFYDEIMDTEIGVQQLFKEGERPEKWYFDLPSYVRLKLAKENINQVINHCENTFIHPDKYYSYRRDKQFNIQNSKRNVLSAIMLKPE